VGLVRVEEVVAAAIGVGEVVAEELAGEGGEGGGEGEGVLD